MRTPDQSIQVQVIARDWRRRVFRLSGRVRARIIYHVEENGRHRLLINGGDAQWGSDSDGSPRFFAFSVVDHSNGWVPARLEIRAGRFLDSLAFRLKIGEKVVYEDRAFERLDRLQRARKLPVPSAAPPPDPASLPLPGPRPGAGT
jgi:hypothetical protein